MFALPTPAAVTLMIMSGGRRGALVPYTFESPAKFETHAATHTILLVSKDGEKKKGVLSLADALSGVDGDFLLQTTPFDDLDEAVNKLKRHRQNMSSEERATTLAVAASPLLRAEFGDVRLLADGCPVQFVATDKGKIVLEADGIAVNSVVVIMNEAKQVPDVADVKRLLRRAAILEDILSDPTLYTTDPPELLSAMEGITQVVPILSGYYFDASVVAACKAAGLRYMTLTLLSDSRGGHTATANS